MKQLLAAAVIAALPGPLAAQDITSEMLYTMMPAPLDGWSAEVSPEAADRAALRGASLAMQAYTGPDEAAFTLTIMYGGPITELMLEPFADPDRLTSGGTTTELDGGLFLHRSTQVTGAVGEIVFQAEGNSTDLTPIFDHIRTLDLSEIAAIFDAP